MNVLIFAGSTREGSINQKLVEALTGPLKAGGFDVDAITLADYDMPLYNGDWEDAHGAPDAAKALAAEFKSHDAVVMVTPEYNGGLPPLLKNTIDWLTRLEDMSHYHAPVFGIASCTPGAMNGIMVMRQVAYILNRLGCEVIPTQLGVGPASSAFADDGSLANERTQGMAEKFVTSLKERVERKG